MFPFRPENKQPAADLTTVESARNDLIPEEFPEGAYGSDIPLRSQGKSSPWRDDQRSPNPYGYENKLLHHNLDRDYPGDDGADSASDDPDLT